MLLTPEDLRRIAARTLAHYDQNAQAYWAGTRNHDVRQNIDALLQYIEAKPPFALLDFGCGPGRDLTTFKALGHRVTGLEGSAQLAALARTNSGCDVVEQNFLALDLPQRHFDGVFANAVLFHAPSQVLPRILRQLHTTLKPGGVLFSSNPRGDGHEGWNGDRYGAFYDWQAWRSHVSAAGFLELTHFYRPTGLPLEQQPWLASVWRKPIC
jgi:SAM-dependent methyltransferase